MRLSILSAAALLAACAAPSPQAPTATIMLIAADASTMLAVGERITLERRSEAGAPGMDAVINLALRHADGRRMGFQEANHAPHDLYVQRAGGPLAQVMALPETAAPTLNHAADGEGARGAPFFCAPQGAAAIGLYEAPDGATHVVGLREAFQVETLPNGELNALPYSPDLVCARLNFRRG